MDINDDKARFEGVGLRPVVNRSYPRRLDLTIAVLRSQNVDEARIQEWMRRQQERALQDTVRSAALVAD